MNSNQEALYYKDTHDGSKSEYSKILIYIHGILASHSCWNLTVNEVAKLDPSIRQIRIDLPGSGRSQFRSNLNSVKDLSQELMNFIQNTLGLDDETIVKKVTLVGWSLGGSVALQTAALWPSLFQRLILTSISPLNGKLVAYQNKDGVLTNQRCATKEDLAQTPGAKFMLNLLASNDPAVLKPSCLKAVFTSGRYIPDEEVNRFVQEQLLQSNQLDTMWVVHNFDLTKTGDDSARNVKGKVLIIHGKMDTVVSSVHAETMRNELQNSCAELIIRDDLGHGIPMEDPQFTAQQIVNFFK